MQTIKDKKVDLVIITHEEIEEKLMKYLEKYKGHEIRKVFLIREIQQEMRKQGIIISEDYIRKFLRKLEKNGIVEQNKHFVKIF